MKSFTFVALALVTATACTLDMETDETTGEAEQALPGTSWHFRSNATSWENNDASRLLPGAIYMQSLFFDVKESWMLNGADAVFTQVTPEAPWGLDYGLVHGTSVVVPGGDQLQRAGSFSVRYPALGRYVVTLNDRQGSFMIERASASKSWEPEPNGVMTTIARGYGIGCGSVTNGPTSAVVGYMNGNLYRTSNANVAAPTWQRLDQWTDASGGKHDLPGSAVLSIAVNPCNEREVLVSFAGTTQGTKFFKTGTLATWQQVNMPMEVWSVSYDPSTIGHLYAIGTNGGVLESSNYGDTWSSTAQTTALRPPLSGERISTVSMLGNDLKTAVVGTTAGRLYMSFDVTAANQSWISLGSGLPSTAVTRVTTNPKLSPPEIYATFLGMRNAVWRSANGGQSFASIQNPALPANDYPASIYGFAGVSLVPGQEQVLVVNGIGMYGAGRSEDRGQSYTWVSN